MGGPEARGPGSITVGIGQEVTMGNDVVEVTADGAVELIGAGAYVLDVREHDEWELGHAPDAHHVPLSSVPDHIDSLPRNEVIVCVCRSGGRSARAAEFLADNGFDVRNLAGGMRAWQDAGYPLVGTGGEPTIG
jgi:rhodanese-related sulfurtransferase